MARTTPVMQRIIKLSTVEAMAAQGCLDGTAVQGVDLSSLDLDSLTSCVKGTLFLGCILPPGGAGKLTDAGAIVMPRLPELPYDPYRTRLYTWRDLYDDDFDLKVWEHFVAQGGHQPPMLEAIAQRLHDHSIEDALGDLLAIERRIVGIMGGHSVPRTHPDYALTAETARQLCAAGYYVATGGGPGLMEAGNLGAYFGRRSADELQDALAILKSTPEHLPPALEVLERYPEGCESLAIPTWFYGHEPSNVFGTYVAKYFSNSLREDGLLAICLHGILYERGSAGTTQEIFQDAAQNHYGSFGWYSPMVFLGTERYARETQIYPTLKGLAQGKVYDDLLLLTDDPREVVGFLQTHPPLKYSPTPFIP